MVVAMSENVLRDVFQIPKVSEAHYGRFETDGPWAVQVGARDVLSVYAVIEGDCVIEAPDCQSILLGAGDVAVLLTPAPHILRSRQGTPRMHPEAALHTFALHEPSLRNERQRAPSTVRLLSGRIGCEEARDSFWSKLVPKVLTMRDQTHVVPWLEATLHFIVEEVRASRPGSQTLATRLTELLLVQLLEKRLETLEATDRGWLTALADPQIGRALTSLHSAPEKPWTVAELARQLGMSRSAFANHFARLVGEPPMHYLTRIRMDRAATLLREGFAATGEVAARVGYVSDASFCKAFKRNFGQSPGAYRRARRSPPTSREPLQPEEAA
jgi:AraC-like DNA-binding protein